MDGIENGAGCNMTICEGCLAHNLHVFMIFRAANLAVTLVEGCRHDARNFIEATILRWVVNFKIQRRCQLKRAGSAGVVEAALVTMLLGCDHLAFG